MAFTYKNLDKSIIWTMDILRSDDIFVMSWFHESCARDTTPIKISYHKNILISSANHNHNKLSAHRN